MPLKHNTETFFVALLAFVLVITGFILSTLPMLPTGLVPWVIVFAVTTTYPSVLMPFFREERADHEFRSLHWFPMIMTVLWLVFALLAWLFPVASIALRAYTWAWSLPMVAFATFGLLVFCGKVLRQWLKRTILVLLLCIPFAILALTSAAGGHYDTLVAHVLWGAFTSENSVAQLPSELDTEKSSRSETSSSSLHSDELAWQNFLASYSSTTVNTSEQSSLQTSSVLSEKEFQDLVLGLFGFGNSSQISSTASSISRIESQGSVSSAPVLIGQTSSSPSHLPKSGFGISVIILTMLAVYGATIHRRQLQS